MKKLLVGLSAFVIAATSLSGVADARPGRGHGHAYGHYKNHHGYRYVAPRGYYAAPRYSYRRSHNGAIAAGVAGAIIGGALGAAAQPTYRTYERPHYGYYSAPRRTYYREEYYGY